MTETARDISRLIIRVSIGGVQIAHGAQKLFGWFGGHGLKARAHTWRAKDFAQVRKVLWPPGSAKPLVERCSRWGWPHRSGVRPLSEPWAWQRPFMRRRVFAAEGGMEYPAVLGLMAAALTLIGPGNISLDQLLGGRLDRPWMRAAALAAPRRRWPRY